jgi:hypothetical protein
MRAWLSSRHWLVVLWAASGFLIWAGVVRVYHVTFITGAAKDELTVDATSPTGYLGGKRRLVGPEDSNESYNWIAQTQQMFAREEWRVRRVDYDNAPFGRDVIGTSPYRWWLGLCAWIDHRVSGRPLGLSVERAVLWADPVLQLLLLWSVAFFVAWRFGAWSATWLALGLVTLFPLADGFLPALPDAHGLATGAALWSMLLLLAGIQTAAPRMKSGKAVAQVLDTEEPIRKARRWFILAGVVGGLGLWVDAVNEVPVLLAMAVGAIPAVWFARKTAQQNPVSDGSDGLPWREWALAGALTTLVAYLIEFFPGHLGALEIKVIHPLYGLAWLAMGELLAQINAWMRRGARAWNVRTISTATLAILALCALPVTMAKTHNGGFLAPNLASLRLTKLPEGGMAANFWVWLVQDGNRLKVGVTLLPLLFLIPAGRLILNRPTSAIARASLAFTFAAVLVTLGFATRRLSYWNELDLMLLALMVAALSANREQAGVRLSKGMFFYVGLPLLLLGTNQFRLISKYGATTTLTDFEARSLMERELAHWLAKRVATEGALVLSPPTTTSALYYFGGLKGLATLDWANQDGTVAAIRLASATSAEEARELIRRRGVTHIIMPSWDAYLDEYARLGLGQLEGSFINRLHTWGLPSWLRPVAYQVPAVNGIQPETITILEVVDEQDDAAKFSRETEYFIEMGQLNLAVSAGQALKRFPADIGALVAKAQLETAQEDPAVAQTINSILTRLKRGGDRGLPWDRRVVLAIVLARSHEGNLAQTQLARCLKEIDEEKLRSLSATTLYRLHVLNKAFGLSIADPRLKALALDLLPADWRSKFEGE